jgi:hypothetical protein
MRIPTGSPNHPAKKLKSITQAKRMLSVAVNHLLHLQARKFIGDAHYPPCLRHPRTNQNECNNTRAQTNRCKKEGIAAAKASKAFGGNNRYKGNKQATS